MEFHVLASGSKGNATFIYENGCGILIDCGISRKQLLYRLKELNYTESDIQYCLLTHDHYDHSKNIHIYKDILYSTVGNYADLNEEHILTPYQSIQLGCFDILPLRTSHDASDPIGFVISTDETLVYMTDTGYVSNKNKGYMKDKDYYIIESNHDVDMLMNTNRPLFLKNRILSDKGHLNNEYSAELMCELIGEHTKEVVLAHLSEEANTKETALNTHLRILKENDISFSNIKVASQVSTVSGGHHED